MLCVIQLPILRPGYAPRSGLVCSGVPGIASARRNRRIDARIDGEFNRGVEDIRRVVIQPENEAALDPEILNGEGLRITSLKLTGPLSISVPAGLPG